MADWLVSGTPGQQLPPLPLPDWALHGLSCAVFGLTLLLPLGSCPAGPYLALLLLAAYGALDEYHQSWIPGRMPAITDWLADVAGGSLVTLAAVVWRWAARAGRLTRRPPRRSGGVKPG